MAVGAHPSFNFVIFHGFRQIRNQGHHQVRVKGHQSVQNGHDLEWVNPDVKQDETAYCRDGGRPVRQRW